MYACSKGYLDIVKYLIENQTIPFTDIHAVNNVNNYKDIYKSTKNHYTLNFFSDFRMALMS